jgi:hypothetical protein
LDVAIRRLAGNSGIIATSVSRNNEVASSPDRMAAGVKKILDRGEGSVIS